MNNFELNIFIKIIIQNESTQIYAQIIINRIIIYCESDNVGKINQFFCKKKHIFDFDVACIQKKERLSHINMLNKNV